MKPSAYYDRVVDVNEELFKFTLMTLDVSPYLVDRYGERQESAEELSKKAGEPAHYLSVAPRSGLPSRSTTSAFLATSPGSIRPPL